MRILFQTLLAAVVVLVLGSATQPASASKDRQLKTLVKWMTGDFSSQAQSQQDSDYYDIRLHIRPIWKSIKGEHWLYVEQATAAAESKPYRQRIYKVEKDGEKGFKSIVYTLPTPEKWAGAYKNVSLFDALKPADLSLREGCTVFLTRQSDGSFVGSTNATDCESSLRGARYATSKVAITQSMLQSWDQGFNEKGEQVWGAVKGGYLFVREVRQ